VAVEVFEGNVGDPVTLASQISKLKQRFKLERVVLIGDRGMITQARIEETVKPAGLNFVTALRAPQIAGLVAAGMIQLSLFDEHDLAEITSPDYPGERLIVCRNPLLAEERARKRRELLDATEEALLKVQARARRQKRPLRGKDKIALAVGAVVNHYKMAKHFQLTITDTDLTFARKGEEIAAEAMLDGIYVVRTDLDPKYLDATATVAAYKQLDCLVGEPASNCPDRIESRSMGKAFDPDAPAEITGEPCLLGLPCGKVGLASDGSLPIRIADRTLTGTLTVFSPRGGGNAKTSDLAGGATLVPTGVLEPGKTYRYRLALRDGSVRAAGEFLVLSQNAQRDSDAALAKAMEEPQDTRERAVIRSLMLDGRDWEAFERTLEASK